MIIEFLIVSQIPGWKFLVLFILATVILWGKIFERVFERWRYIPASKRTEILGSFIFCVIFPAPLGTLMAFGLALTYLKEYH